MWKHERKDFFFLISSAFYRFQMNELEHEIERRTLTYTLWNQSSNHMDKKTWHPMTFEYADASPQHIKEIKVQNSMFHVFWIFDIIILLSSSCILLVNAWICWFEAAYNLEYLWQCCQRVCIYAEDDMSCIEGYIYSYLLILWTLMWSLKSHLSFYLATYIVFGNLTRTIGN